jgi:predicted small lipoprotein YifL
MLIAKRFIRVLVFSLFACLLITACGQKGPLKAPENAPINEQQQGDTESE